ncbi:MAG: FAD-dependent oxidoreductase [Bacteroidota bacterium]
MPNTPQTFLILGGGLAGTFMATRLILANQKVILVDDEAPYGASRVAAGLFNVITGRFGAKTWLAETLLEELSTFMQHPELASATNCIHHSLIYRPFKAVEEYNKWLGRATEATYQDIVDFQESPLRPEKLHNELGGIMIKPCGWVDTTALLKELRKILLTYPTLTYVKSSLAYEQIIPEEGRVKIKGETLSFDQWICCEGFKLGENPWFPEIPIIPNKGEVLLIEAPELQLPFVLSRKIYLIPLGKHKYVVGATYQNKFEDKGPTEWGKEEIRCHLEKAIKVPYKIVAHYAGIRPTTPNRRPILGTHHTHKHIHVLGGFGTKGVLFAPYCSRLLTERLLGNGPNIPDEIKLERFY